MKCTGGQIVQLRFSGEPKLRLADDYKLSSFKIRPGGFPDSQEASKVLAGGNRADGKEIRPMNIEATARLLHVDKRAWPKAVCRSLARDYDFAFFHPQKLDKSFLAKFRNRNEHSRAPDQRRQKL
jgi:hypothetical protein